MLATQFFEPLAMNELLRDAWVGASAALLRTVSSEVPPPPEFPADSEAAYAINDQAFSVLEHFAGRQLSSDELATAALDELLNRQRDVHTVRLVPGGRFWPFEIDVNSPAGWASRTFGMTLTDRPPLTVIDVLARGPAQRAGVRRGQTVLAINGKPTAHLRRAQAMARLDWHANAINVLTVATPDSQPMDLALQSELLPMPAIQLLPGPVGFLRMDGFTATDAETAAFRGIRRFRAGGRARLDHRHALDRRWPVDSAQPHLINSGRLFSRIRHNELRLADGIVLPKRQDVDFDGTALHVQRPMVVLIGPGSISGAESFAGPLQAYRRAALVGERTAGACGVVRTVQLAPRLDSLFGNAPHGLRSR